MPKRLKIVIPTAGWATRMRPQTWSKPKPLVSVAGRTALDHLLESFRSLPPRSPREYVIIYGPGLGQTQIPPYLREHHPALKVHYVLQPEMKGQSDALWQAREHLDGPMIVCFSDTLIEADFSFLAREPEAAVAWVKPFPDPRRFGVAELDAGGRVTRLVEKPTSLDNNLVVVGCYYLPEGRDLVKAVEEQFRRGGSLKGEYFLTGSLNLMIQAGLKMRTERVETWLDTGTIQATLETNRYLLEHGRANRPKDEVHGGVEIIAPVFLHPSAEVRDAVIGPHVSIGADCRITNARVADSILEAGAAVDSAALQGSFLGRQARVVGRSVDDPPLVLNIGDDSSVLLK